MKPNRLTVPRFVFAMVGLLVSQAVSNYYFNRMFGMSTSTVYGFIHEADVIMAAGGGVAFAVMNTLIERGERRGHPRWRRLITGIGVGAAIWTAFRIGLTLLTLFSMQRTFDPWFMNALWRELGLFALLLLFWTFAAVAWAHPIKRVGMSLGVAAIFLFGFIPLWTMVIDRSPVHYRTEEIVVNVLWVMLMWVVPWLPDVLSSLKTEKQKPKLA